MAGKTGDSRFLFELLHKPVLEIMVQSCRSTGRANRRRGREKNDAIPTYVQALAMAVTMQRSHPPCKAAREGRLERFDHLKRDNPMVDEFLILQVIRVTLKDYCRRTEFQGEKMSTSEEEYANDDDEAA